MFVADGEPQNPGPDGAITYDLLMRSLSFRHKLTAHSHSLARAAEDAEKFFCFSLTCHSFSDGRSAENIKKNKFCALCAYAVNIAFELQRNTPVFSLSHQEGSISSHSGAYFSE